MLLDKEQQFSDSQALSEDGDTDSTNVLDTSSDRDLGPGEPLLVMVNVEVAPDDGNGDETYTFKVQTDDNEAMNSPSDLTGAVTIPRTAAQGDKFYADIPPNGSMERYLKLVYTLGGTSASVTVSAHLIPKRYVDHVLYKPSGFSV